MNPNIDIESKLYEMQSQINVATVKKKSHLKSKQTYLSSQSKKLDEKMPGMQTLAQGQKDLDKICEEIDQICKDKIIHEQANQTFVNEVKCQNSVLMNKQVELTDSIYGVI